MSEEKDALDKLIDEASIENPDFPRMVEEALAKRRAEREREAG
jgi:hypothetical protein